MTKSRIALYVLLMGLLATAQSCKRPTDSQATAAQGSMSKRMERIQRDTGLVLPTDARLVEFFEAPVAVDPRWVAKVSVPQSRVEALKSEILSKRTYRSSISGAMGSSNVWWRVGKIIATNDFLSDPQTFVRVILSTNQQESTLLIECAVF
jgi:hypothetical protein